MQTADCGCMKTTYDQSSITSYTVDAQSLTKTLNHIMKSFITYLIFAEKVTSTQARLKCHPGVNSGCMLIYERQSLL